MKKKIFIMAHSMEPGGAERSLIGLLDALNADEYDVDLFLLRHEGEFMNMIPTKINLLPQIKEYTVLARPMKETLKEGHIILTSARLAGKIAAKFYDAIHGYSHSGVALEYSHKFTAPFMPQIDTGKEYDLAISFLTPHYFTAQKVNAKRKAAWIHTDYSNVSVNVKSETKMWDRYDNIVSISTSVTESFLGVFPTLKEKIILIENILPQNLILSQADSFLPSAEMSHKGIKLLSIGRYSYRKNFDNIPLICSILTEKGFDVCWYIIGYGPDERLIKGKIRQFGMQDRVILLGKKANPYPYIKACDIYVQPSRYEGKSIAVREAQMLAKPVVITNFPTAKSQLTDGYDGVIVPSDNEGCANGLAELLKNPGKIEFLIENCKKRDYSNSDEIDKVYSFLM